MVLDNIFSQLFTLSNSFNVLLTSATDGYVILIYLIFMFILLLFFCNIFCCFFVVVWSILSIDLGLFMFETFHDIVKLTIKKLNKRRKLDPI